ncbi:unnamed protein product [Ixodes pacificus]
MTCRLPTMNQHHSRRKDGLWKVSLGSNFLQGNVQITYLLSSLQVLLESLLCGIIVQAGVVWFHPKQTPNRDTLRRSDTNPSGHSNTCARRGVPQCRTKLDILGRFYQRGHDTGAFFNTAGALHK